MNIQPGGTDGGAGKFLLGAALTIAGLWFFFDSVQFTTGARGMISGMMGGGGEGGRGGRGIGETTSMGIVLVPLFIGIVALFYDVRKTWGWVILWLGVAILVIEIVSRFRPVFSVSGTHAILMAVLIAGGIGLMLRAYKEDRDYQARVAAGASQKKKGAE